jgi:DNA-3-methyladenine glycosylase
MNEVNRYGRSFYTRNALTVARELIGQSLTRRFPDGTEKTYLITETEAYLGEEDLACHASKGRTKRTEIMYHEGGHVYVYLIYGMYWMLNVVTGPADHPQAVLIRGISGLNGPGKLTRALGITKELYGEDLVHSTNLWIGKREGPVKIKKTSRVGVDYAGKYWAAKPWRFVLLPK